MKQEFNKALALFLLVVVAFTSTGATVYSHFCATTNQSYTGYTKNECETEQQQEQKSCHQEKQEPCCTDSSEFDTQEQYVSKFELPPFFTYSIESQVFSPVEISYPTNFPKVVNVLPRPPNLRACIRFQQVLC